MTYQRQRRHCWHTAAGTVVAALAIMAGFLAPTISPVSAASTTTTTTTSTTTTTTVPGSNCSASVSGTAFDRTGWVASTNAPSSSADAPANALDGDLATRFSTNEDQAPGLYFEVDLGSARTFDALEMSVPNSPTDYARGYDVEVSSDASSWATVAACTGAATPQTVGFSAQTARYVKVVLTATTTSQWWSIDEFNLYGAPVITSASGWGVVPGQANTFTVTTTGAPVPALSLTGTLPPGLVFKDNDNGTATISGTPPADARGTYAVTVTANNGVGSPAVQYLALALGAAPVITSASAWGVVPGRDNTFTVTTTGAPAPALSLSGTLPPGLAFTAHTDGTATISGAPPADARGTYALTVTATNGVGSPAVQDLVLSLGGAPVITSAATWRVLPGQYNAFTITTTGSPVPVLSRSGTLPAGLGFIYNHNGTATISGTVPADARGTYELTITATNGVGSPAVQYLALSLGGAPVITSVSGWRVVPGQYNTFTVTTTGSPVPLLSLSGSLPPGLVFRDNLNGTATISGTPPANARGTFDVTITATNGVGTPALQYLVMTLGGARTTTSLSSSADPASVGQAVTYTARVVPTPNGGTVNFLANGGAIAGCTGVPVNTTNGEATCPTTYLSIGARSVQASYSGDAAFGPSASGVHTEVVTRPGAGYWLASANGAVYGLGAAPWLGGTTTSATTGPVVGIAATPSATGYWVVTANGTVTSFGDAKFYGDLPDLGKHVGDVVAIAPTTNGRGYYLVGADGGFFTFGDAKFHGSLPGIHLHVKDVVGVVATPGGSGYLLVGADGGVFTFGTTRYYGSLPGLGKRVQDIRAILPSSTGRGYILVGADGGAFSFGSGAKFHGSLPGEGVRVSNIVGIALTPDDAGYWMAGTDGHVYGFGDAQVWAAPAALPANLPVAAIAGT